MTLANRLKLIKESPTIAISTLANKMKNDGLDIITLAAGEPDFNTPDNIKDFAIDAIKNNKTKYTPVSGINELKNAIKDKFLIENNLNFELNEIIVSSGAKHSIYNALQTIIDSNDEVIIPTPYWVSYPDMVLMSNGIPIFIECDYNSNYKLTAEKLKNTITTKTKALILNSPNNPSGIVYNEDELKSLAEVLINYPNIYIITDDIYEHIIFSHAAFKNILNVCPELQERVIVINGISKAYAMTGWRIGYAACKNVKLIKGMEIIQSQSTSNPCTISQYAAIEALKTNYNNFKYMNKEFIKRNNYVNSRINNIKGLKSIKPQGAFYTFIDCNEAITNLFNKNKIEKENDLALAKYLLENFLIACVPGSAFGLKNHLRISFATSIEELTNGIDRIEKALK